MSLAANVLQASVGPSPSHWKHRRLRDLVRVVNGHPFPSESFGPDGDLPLVRIRDILAQDFETYVSGEVPRQVILRDGDVVIGMDGDFNVAVWRRGSAALNQRLCLLRPRETVDMRFIAYSLPSILKVINDLTFSTTVKHLSSGDLLNERILLPPIEEQERIANFLDGALRRLNVIEQTRKKQRALLEESIQGEVSEAMTPGILSDKKRDGWFPWLPALPESVPLVRLGYVSRLQSGLTVDGARMKTADDVTRPYLRVANVQVGYVSLDSVAQITVPRALAARSTLRSGDVLMTEGGDLDKLGRGTVWRGELADCLHQNHVFAIRVDRDRLDPDYLALATRSIHGRCYFESTGVKTTNLASTNSSKISSFPVPLPVIARQRAVVAELSRSLETVERVRNAIDHQMARLQEWRQSIVAAAVTGQIDVTTARGVDE